MNSYYRRIITNRESYITTLGRLFEYSTAAFSKRKLSGFVYNDSQDYTYIQFKQKCIELSHRLSRFGISAGDKVAILSQKYA